MSKQMVQRPYYRPTVEPGSTGREPRRTRTSVKLLALYFVLLPVAVGDRTGSGASIAPADVAIGLLAVLMLRDGLRFRKNQWTVWQFALLLVLAIGAWNASQIASVVTSYALIQKLGGFIVYLITFYVVVSIVHRRTSAILVMKMLVVSVALHSSVAATVYILQRWDLMTAEVYNEGDRLSGLLHDPNAFGGLVAISSLFHLGLRFANAYDLKSMAARGGLGIVDVILPIALFLTYSRTAWIAWILGVALFFLPSISTFRRAIPAAICAALALIGLLSTDYGATARSLAQREATVTTRLDINRAAIEYFSESPIVGKGLGVFLEEHGVIVHNTALWFAAEMGVLGLVAFVGYCIAFVMRGVRLLKRDARVTFLARGLLCSHVVMIVMSFGIETFYQRAWWLSVALIGALSGASLERRSGKRRETPAEFGGGIVTTLS